MAPSYPFASSLVIDPVRREELVLVNAAGRRVWQRFAAGHSIDTVSQEISFAGQRSFGAVQRDLTDLVELWRQQGLLDTPDTAPADGSSIAPEIVDAGLQIFRKTQWRVLEICGVPISVGIASPRWKNWSRHVLVMRGFVGNPGDTCSD